MVTHLPVISLLLALKCILHKFFDSLGVHPKASASFLLAEHLGFILREPMFPLSPLIFSPFSPFLGEQEDLAEAQLIKKNNLSLPDNSAFSYSLIGRTRQSNH